MVDYDKIIMILKKIRSIIDDENTDMIYSGYDTKEEVINEIDIYISKLMVKDCSVIAKINLLFAPTGTFQELSISNNWSDLYMELSELFDRAIK